jgi:hypothetical protein
VRSIEGERCELSGENKTGTACMFPTTLDAFRAVYRLETCGQSRFYFGRPLHILRHTAYGISIDAQGISYNDGGSSGIVIGRG